MKVALATCSRIPALTDDDRLLQQELRARGAETVAVVWDDPAVHWRDFDCVIIRSCWDYHLRLVEFMEWLALLERERVALWNPAALVRANAHKTYLEELATAGLSVVSTAFLDRGARLRLGDVLEQRRWDEAVVKPAVSASAFQTWKVSRLEAGRDEAERRFQDLLAHSDLLVQPFVPEVVEPGEWSLVFIDGRYSHAVLKTPAKGDFRVQSEFGGAVRTEPPSPSLVAQAERVAAWIPRPWLYARIDGVERDGALMLMEVELIEPHLFLGSDAGAAGRLADALLRT